MEGLIMVFGFFVLNTIFESEKEEISSKVQVKNKAKFLYVQFLQTLSLNYGHFAICHVSQFGLLLACVSVHIWIGLSVNTVDFYTQKVFPYILYFS